jgi:hypothetical protein
MLAGNSGVGEVAPPTTIASRMTGLIAVGWVKPTGIGPILSVGFTHPT